MIAVLACQPITYLKVAKVENHCTEVRKTLAELTKAGKQSHHKWVSIFSDRASDGHASPCQLQ